MWMWWRYGMGDVGGRGKGEGVWRGMCVGFMYIQFFNFQRPIMANRYFMWQNRLLFFTLDPPSFPLTSFLSYFPNPIKIWRGERKPIPSHSHQHSFAYSLQPNQSIVPNPLALYTVYTSTINSITKALLKSPISNPQASRKKKKKSRTAKSAKNQ